VLLFLVVGQQKQNKTKQKSDLKVLKKEKS